jgi:hypothetical protein
MFKQLQGTSKAVLEYVKTNPGKNVNEIAAGVPGAHNSDDVAGSLWALWAGKYVNRSRNGNTGRGPRFVYFFKTDKPRHKRRSVIVQGGKAPVVKDDRQMELDFAPDNGVEILVAVKGTKETLALTPEQARALYTSLAALLGMRR